MGLAAGAMGLQAFSSIYTSSLQADALKMQGQFQKQQFEANARIAEIQGKDAIRRGENEAQAIQGKTESLIGTQRAALGAQGIEVDSGSARDIQVDTAGLGALDQLTVKNNAMREAWGYKVQAANLTGQANVADISSKVNARNTLITGGLNAATSATKGAYYANGGTGAI